MSILKDWDWTTIGVCVTSLSIIIVGISIKANKQAKITNEKYCQNIKKQIVETSDLINEHVNKYIKQTNFLDTYLDLTHQTQTEKKLVQITDVQHRNFTYTQNRKLKEFPCLLIQTKNNLEKQVFLYPSTDFVAKEIATIYYLSSLSKQVKIEDLVKLTEDIDADCLSNNLIKTEGIITKIEYAF
ncbi:hypothetical protein HOK51_00505 [Candidatus Woesearchaeota archaeon]|nr:hypothetical protein [Candidatus Woesearchaeota archaeon]MBT6518294.1 hypothetical protein [Candidatus Woesearchaeota archaeon]MBT7367077.1 hypothetical protein [Candidatus Woesearchaeota archaeon]